MKHWIGLFRSPEHAIVTDNGGEFSNEIMRSLCENFNLVVKTTAAYSPFSNGICERQNDTLSHILEKVRIDHPNLDIENCLSYSCFAKNSLYNNHGYTPTQIVMKRSPLIPVNIDNKLRALEGYVFSKTVADHIVLLHKTRIEYLKSESCEKIRRALRHNVRKQERQVSYGEKVFFRRSVDKKWHGPASVTGVDSSIVFLRQGGQVPRVHSTDVQAIEGSDVVLSRDEKQENTENNSKKPETEESVDHQTIEENKLREADEPAEFQAEQPEFCESADLGEASVQTETTNGDSVTDFRRGFENLTEKRPKRHQTVKFTAKSSELAGEKYQVKILGPAGKAKGRYKNCWNIQYEKTLHLAGSLGKIDFSTDVSSWERVGEVNGTTDKTVAKEFFVSDSSNSEETFETAKLKELES